VRCDAQVRIFDVAGTAGYILVNRSAHDVPECRGLYRCHPGLLAMRLDPVLEHLVDVLIFFRRATRDNNCCECSVPADARARFLYFVEKDRYWSAPATDASMRPPVMSPLKAKLRLAEKFWLTEVSELSHRMC